MVEGLGGVGVGVEGVGGEGAGIGMEGVGGSCGGVGGAEGVEGVGRAGVHLSVHLAAPSTCSRCRITLSTSTPAPSTMTARGSCSAVST